ncbi:MAG TPA: hypothetical protein VL086_09165 [Candidatus Nitrosotalea sp.]|nr:hypothetical protein [Candidatus Nitrosotalea sp.]
MSTPSIDRNALLARAERLGWPTVAVMGFGITGDAQWRKAVRQCFPVELADLARQLDDFEATRPVRSTEPEPVYGALPLLDDEEMRQVEAERVTRMEVAESERQRRLREEENLRLNRQGIR